MKEFLSRQSAPELVFGLIAPIGVDLDLVAGSLGQCLRDVRYSVEVIRPTQLMLDVETGLPNSTDGSVESYRQRIAYANAVRKKLGNEAMSALAISAIRSYRNKRWSDEAKIAPPGPQEPASNVAEERPLPSQAYIIRQLKRPEEVLLLRRVYGRQFVLVSAYAPQDVRLKRIENKAKEASIKANGAESAHTAAFDLIEQDANEDGDRNGQKVRDAFPLADVFIDASTRKSTEETIKRFVSLLFNSPRITPTPDEYGMYVAKSVSLRSSDLSRQVGAAIFKSTREVVSLGCNEVPKAGGGTYWEGDDPDARDFQLGFDANEREKTQIIVDLVERLRRGGHLTGELGELTESKDLAERILSDPLIAQSNAMSLIEFGRAVHAEASALADAARLGRSVSGATLYCTTFPCHLCATGIVAAGVRRVVFVEPYPKSYAKELHDDAITLTKEAGKVSFEPFVGVSPYRYRDLFEKGKRKYTGGKAHEWNEDERRPLIEVYFPSYFRAETNVVSQLAERLLAE